MKYALMEQLRADYPVPLMCRIYDVSPAGYYAWQGRPPSQRLQEALADNGVNTTVHRVKRLRKKLGIRCKQKRKFKVTTDSNHTMPDAPNLLDQKFTATRPNQIWVSDITYIPTDEGWLYLAGHKDLFSGDLAGMP